jgi:NAD(P)-dependent dehydrogenase (short-subunit alcohol dehydrogenase family)
MRSPSETVIVVTGATDGIGRQTALELARKGCQVVVHGRAADRVARARALIAESVPGARTSGVVFDLASFAEVRRGAAELLARSALHVLINNAGLYPATPGRTVDGHEEAMQVNHLSPYLLTRLLLPLLIASAPARVVNVSSNVHTSGRVDPEDLDNARHWSSYASYATSKLANILFTRALAHRLDPAQVTANALHPGIIATKLLRDNFGMGGATLAAGARTSLKLALDPALATTTGRYFADEEEASASRAAQDDALAEALWRKSAELVGLPP